ncbi:MAG: hypothetical protein QHC90_06570 [Shinella sp.]|nr:hypothetical protein [Shinella sp.]
MIWTVIAVALVLGAFIFRRRFRSDDEAPPEEDTGLAILEFGRAFPSEAIRQIITADDGRTAFLRLHDGKVGCMRAHGHHFASHLIEPGAVRVSNGPGGKALALEFLDTAFESGIFEFRTSADAAEVSLWLLGSFMPAELESSRPPAGKSV